MKKIGMWYLMVSLVVYQQTKSEEVIADVEDTSVHPDPASIHELVPQEDYLIDLDPKGFLDCFKNYKKKIQKKTYLIKLQELGHDYGVKLFVYYLHMKEYIQSFYHRLKQRASVYYKTLNG
jgi:hypothetical protein